MRIDGTYQPARPDLPEGKLQLQGKQAGLPPDISEAEGPKTPVAPEELLNQARSAPEVNDQAVAEARQLLASGQLDTPEAALRAARAIMGLGI